MRRDGRIRDLGHIADRPRVAGLGSRREAARRFEPLDERRAGEPLAVGTRGLVSGAKQEPVDRGGIDGDARVEHGLDEASVLGLPGRPAEVRRDKPAAFVEQVGARSDEAPAVTARDRVAPVDLDADGVGDEEHLVRALHCDRRRDLGHGRPGVGCLRERQRRSRGHDRRREQPDRAAEARCTPFVLRRGVHRWCSFSIAR
jgi:hypothetical protein